MRTALFGSSTPGTRRVRCGRASQGAGRSRNMQEADSVPRKPEVQTSRRESVIRESRPWERSSVDRVSWRGEWNS